MRFHKIIRLRRIIQPPERARRLELLKSFRITLIQRFYHLCQLAVFLPRLKQTKKRCVCHLRPVIDCLKFRKTSNNRFKSFTGFSGRQDKKETNSTDSSLLWKDDLFINISTTKPETLCAGAHSNAWSSPIPDLMPHCLSGLFPQVRPKDSPHTNEQDDQCSTGTPPGMSKPSPPLQIKFAQGIKSNQVKPCQFQIVPISIPYAIPHQ